MNDRKATAPNRLRELRLRSRLTQREVETLTGLDHTTISKHESGDREMDAEDIALYAKVYKVETHELFMDTGDKPWNGGSPDSKQELLGDPEE